MEDYRDFLEYAEAFYDESTQSIKEKQNGIAQRQLISSVLFSWISIECFINDMMADFTSLPKDIFSLNEWGLLNERSVEFIISGENIGKFINTEKTQYWPLENKILFLVTKFGDGYKINKGETLWQKFNSMKDIRDKLTHPRKANEIIINPQIAKDNIDTAKAVISLVAEKVWQKKIDF